MVKSHSITDCLHLEQSSSTYKTDMVVELLQHRSHEWEVDSSGPRRVKELTYQIDSCYLLV